MSTIVTRSGKGSPLTNSEVDTNFTNLNTDKVQSGDTVASLTITNAVVASDLTVDTSTFKVDSSNNRVGVLNASPDVSLDAGSATDAVHVPTGTTAQRPASPSAGYFRYNSTTEEFEGYTDSWGSIGGSGATNITLNEFTGDGSDTTFTLGVTVATENNTQVYIDGVFQEHATYSISGTTLTFSTAPANLSSIEVMSFTPSSIGTPSDDTVSTVKIQDNAVTLEKMAGGTDGNIISYDASGDPVAVATGNAGQVLTSAGAGSPPSFTTISAGLTLDTTVKTSGFTAVVGNQYLCNTSGGAFNVTMPSSPSAGDTFGIIDYNGTFDTNNITLVQASSKKILRAASNGTIDTKNWSTNWVFIDDTVGWLPVDGS